MPALYRETDVAAVLLRDRPLFADALPTKTFEAMAAGRPLVLAAKGEVAQLVEGAGAGVVVAPDDSDGLAAALTFLADLPERELRAIGARGATCAREFGREAMVEAWVELLDGVRGYPRIGIP